MAESFKSGETFTGPDAEGRFRRVETSAQDEKFNAWIVERIGFPDPLTVIIREAWDVSRRQALEEAAVLAENSFLRGDPFLSRLAEALRELAKGQK